MRIFDRHSDPDFHHAPSRLMRAFARWTQPPQGPVDTGQSEWNAYLPSRFGMRWEGGLFPNQPFPATTLDASSPVSHGAPMWPRAVSNAHQYLFTGGTAQQPPGAPQIVQFKEATDAMKPDLGMGPGSAFKAPRFHGMAFGVVDT